LLSNLPLVFHPLTYDLKLSTVSQNVPYFPANKPIFWTYFCDLIFWGRLIGQI